ncbi:hypothetical protein F-E9_173 [Faustovirus]|nr:hypothetical protein F-E9_173 [Faustovirus]
MQYFPFEIKERITDYVAGNTPVLTIALGQTNHEFNYIVSAKYKAAIRRECGHFNSLAASLYTAGCHKLAFHYISYTRTESDGLGVIYNKIFSHGSTQLVEQFIRGIMPKYLRSWPELTGFSFIPYANFRVIKRRCDELNIRINDNILIRLVRVGCNKLAKWALEQLLSREYDKTLACNLLERGNTALIRRLMAVNMELFLGEGAIKWAIKGNCDREIFDLLYGLGAEHDCHTIDNTISYIKTPEMMNLLLEYNENIHGHTEQSILNTCNVPIIEAFMRRRDISMEALDCSKTAFTAITTAPSLLPLLCRQLIASHVKMLKIINKCAIEHLRAIFDYLWLHHRMEYNVLRSMPLFLAHVLENRTEATITDKSKSKVWLLYTYQFAVPNDLIKLMHKHDNIILAGIVLEKYGRSPLELLVSTEVGSKLRAYYSDLCSKLTPLLATKAGSSQMT